MEYLVEIGVALILSILTIFGFKKIITMETRLTDHESRLKVEESKGTSRDKVAEKTFKLLDKIHGDISQIKEEQGYWRGVHAQEAKK